MEYQEGGDNFGRDDQDWGYKYENGPNTWRAKYPRCKGYRQSPVALPSKPHHVVHAKPVTYKNLNIPQPALLRNTGTALEIVLKGDKLPTNTGIYKNERTRYKLFKVVVHWGKENARGAEHSIGGEQFCAEIKTLKYNDKYKSPEEALGRPDGILSSSTLLKVSKESSHEKVSKKSSTAKWEELVSKLPKCSGTSKPVEVLLDADFFWHEERHDYYLYEGSLTTPPCSENVVQQVFTDIAYISEHALEALRRVKNEKGEDVCDNFRPIQPLNKRKVTLVKETGHAHQYEQDDSDRFMDDHSGRMDYHRNDQFMGDHSGNERFMDDHSGHRDYHFNNRFMSDHSGNERFMDDHSGRRDYHSNDRFMDDHSGHRDYHFNDRFMSDHSGNERFMDDHSRRRDYYSNDRFMDDHSGRRDYHGIDRFMDDHSGHRDYHRNDRFMDDHPGRRDYHQRQNDWFAHGDMYGDASGQHRSRRSMDEGHDDTVQTSEKGMAD